MRAPSLRPALLQQCGRSIKKLQSSRGAQERFRDVRTIRRSQWRAERKAPRALFGEQSSPAESPGISEDSPARVSEDGQWDIPMTYYELLDLDEDASADEIKTNYRRLQKYCHPDIAGEEGTEVCVILNDAYSILMDTGMRSQYNATLLRARRVRDGKSAQPQASPGAERNYDGSVDVFGYTGQSLSTWMGTKHERYAVFVDETACIGCRNCVHCASGTFKMEEDFGRARVHTQWGNSREDVEIAVDSCPVECIHFVTRDDLPLLEYCMGSARRVGVAVMQAGAAGGDDPFAMARAFREKRLEEWQAWSNRGGDVGEWDALKNGLGALGAEIGRAWRALKPETRRKGWRSWSGASESKY